MDQLRIPPVGTMADETLILHMENRHPNDFLLSLPAAGPERRLFAPVEWRTFHERQHRSQGEEYDHVHNPA